MAKKMTTEEFIAKAKEVHGDKYDYSKTEYVSAHGKVCIICPKHGEFWQAATHHVRGRGCPKCSYEVKSERAKWTTEEFIEKAKAVHGDKYDYSKVVYNGANEKVCIVCPEHGEFWQSPSNHLGGNGCPKCVEKNTTSENFIEKAKAVHGDKYDYSKSVYVNAFTPVCIICPKHGEFYQRPSTHLRGSGCPKCANEHANDRIKETTESFIEKAKAVHGDKYDYSKTEYVNSKTPVTIVCPEHGEFSIKPCDLLQGHGCSKCVGRNQTKEDFIEKARKVHGDKYDYSKVVYVNATTPVCVVCPEHGEFMVKPTAHISSKRGCPKCVGRGKTTEDFIADAKAVHGDKYDYSKVEYVDSKTKVCIICPKHGEFWQLPIVHLKTGGCPKCGIEATKSKQTHTKEDFIRKAREIHGDKYDYSKVEYVNSKTKVCIVCPEHGEFWQTPQGHLGGKGCRKCTSPNFSMTTEEFIEKAKAVHGNKYDYSKVKYEGTKKSVCIICHEKDRFGIEHGEFWQTPESHLKGAGCTKCAGKYQMSTEEFIEKAKVVHGDRYDYSKVVYNGGDEKVCIICPEHGEFWQSPYHHLNGVGCPNCQGLRKEYKISLLTENDVQKNPADNRFFCLTGLEILSLIKAGVLPKDFLSIARTPRGSRARLEAIQTLVNDLSSDENEEENIDTENVDVESIETLEEIERVDEEDSSDMVVDETTGLPVLDSRENVLRNGDIQGIDKLDPTSENGKFIVVNTIKKWWQVVSDDKTFVDEIRNYHGSKFYDYIKEEFFKEYDAVMGMKNPEGYSLPFDLYPYQKILAHKLETRSSYSLWLDMGGGKTYSCIFASRHNNLRNNVVIAPKSVLQESWVSSLYESFPDSKVVTFFGESVDEFKVEGKKDYNKWVDGHVTVVRNIKDFTDFDGDYNYLLINYDKFSQSYAKELVERISDNYRVDYVILDETQKVKYRESTGDVSERNKHVAYLLDKIRKSNPDVKVSALTGTPLINELSEVKSIVELATGEEVSGIKNNRINIGNVSEANKALVLNGFRYRPKINVKHVLLTPEIECSEELERTIRELARQKSYYGELESALAIAKINSPEVISEIKPGTIIYLLYPYKNNTATEIIQKVESLGFKVGAYLGCTPNKHEVFDDFVNGKTDVLVASSPISVGVNGLQNRSDRMIIISLPQTNADYEQLIKRIVRKRKGGSVLEDKDVTIIVPQIVLELNENDEGDESEWSWDRSRMNALLYKKNLGDAVMDGDIQKVFRIDWNKLYRNAMKRFKEGIKDEVETKKNKVVVEEPEENTVQRQRSVSVISETHRMANSSNHETTHQRFIDNPDAFQEYHRAREISKANWVEDPVDYLATFINEHYSNKKIADLGCGTNKLSTMMKNGNTVKGFDHQQVEGHDEVIVADIADLSGVVADREMDIAVFCLSLWGQDYQDYFTEAHRILKNNGRVIVVEPNDDFGEGKRYGDETEFINTVERYGFYRMGSVVKRNNFTYLRFIKED